MKALDSRKLGRILYGVSIAALASTFGKEGGLLVAPIAWGILAIGAIMIERRDE